MYLSTNLSPVEYYEKYSMEYQNNHADGIGLILDRFVKHIETPVIDLGCGRGLITKLLDNKVSITGVDSSIAMIELYKLETSKVGYVGNFWDPLPIARTAIACYSLHLCPSSRYHEFIWRLREAQVNNLIVISPLKKTIKGLGLRILDSCTSVSKSANDKTIWGWVLAV